MASMSIIHDGVGGREREKERCLAWKCIRIDINTQTLMLVCVVCVCVRACVCV